MHRAIFRPTLTGSIQAPLCARSTGHYRQRSPWREREARKYFLELFWCVEGEGAFAADGEEWLLRPGEVCCYFPGDLHVIGAHSPVWEYYWVTFDGDYLPVIMEAFGLTRSARPAGPCPCDLFARLALQLKDLTTAGEYAAAATAYEILSLSRAGGAALPDDHVTAFREMVEERLEDPDFSIGTAADTLGIHRSTLNRLVRAATGVSPQDYLISRRVQEAVSLLSSTGLSVKEIAVRTGCADPNYLAKLLRRRIGHSPSELRKTLF